jgi:unsaturated chondroitin disaccharide hydrolase
MTCYLKLAETLAERFLERLGTMAVPPYDFDDSSPMRPVDSAAAAILASSLLDIAALQPALARRAHWQKSALALLDNLIRECLADEDRHRGMLKHGCYSWPHRDGVDSAVLFGDYFFIEAICKLVMPGNLTPSLSPLSCGRCMPIGAKRM